MKDRKESQQKYLNSFDAQGIYAGFVVGGESELDKAFRKEFNRTYLQVELRTIESIKYDSLTVHGDYIITVKFNQKTTTGVDTAYKESVTPEELESKLEILFKKGGLIIKLNIEKNAIKASKFRTVLSKNFYIPIEVRDTFNV